MKMVLFMVVLLLGFTSITAQNYFKLGLGPGLPIGDAANVADFSVTLDATYLYKVSEKFDLGITTGYSHSFVGDSTIDIGPESITIKGEDFQYVPLAGALRYNIAARAKLGLDLGYAIGIHPQENDGGFYYAPRAQYAVSEFLDIVVAYRGVNADGGSWDIITAGVEFGID